jgi:2-dehydro-3-deoxyphosphogluconate aldolase/(4S)-4-hydroxy-2-oxoglutarate aldolase
MKRLDEWICQPVLPVLVIDDAAKAVGLAQALQAGGLNAIEVTFRTKAAAEAIRRIREALPELVVGAGTVVTGEQAAAALDSGVVFGLAPGLDPAIISQFHARGVPFMPGVMTPSEIQHGIRLGCLCQKFFPAETCGGVAQLKAMAAPFKSFGVKFCPTGGIHLGNMKSYLAMKEVFTVGGSWLATAEQIAGEKWDEITRQVRLSLDSAAGGT